MLSQRMYKYIWGCYKSFPNPFDSASNLPMQVLPCGFHPCSCNFENVSQKESQTRIYGTGNNSVHKYIDLRSGIQQNRNVPSPVSPARGIKAFQLILQPCLACHPAHLLRKLLVQSFWPRWLDAWPYTCCIMFFPGQDKCFGPMAGS